MPRNGALGEAAGAGKVEEVLTLIEARANIEEKGEVFFLLYYSQA